MGEMRPERPRTYYPSWEKNAHLLSFDPGLSLPSQPAPSHSLGGAESRGSVIGEDPRTGSQHHFPPPCCGERVTSLPLGPNPSPPPGTTQRHSRMKWEARGKENWMILASSLPALVLSFLICAARALPSLRLCGGDPTPQGGPGRVLFFDAHRAAVKTLWDGSFEPSSFQCWGREVGVGWCWEVRPPR